MADSERRQRGLEVRKKLWGDGDAPNLADPLIEVTIDHLFGDVWTRPGLALRDRSLITCATLVALGKEAQLKVHLKGLLNQGVSPLEVEEVLMSHPDVQEVAVVSAPHPRLTEVPVAFLILRPGRSTDTQALDTFCRERLANFKVPRRFIVMDDFPRSNAVNRVQKAKLREMIGDAPV